MVLCMQVGATPRRICGRTRSWLGLGRLGTIRIDLEPARPRDVRAVFISKERLSEKTFPSALTVAPELVIELHTELYRRLCPPEKVASLLRFGVEYLWLFDPHEGVLEVVRSHQPRQRLVAGDVLCGDGLLADFCIPIDELMVVEPRMKQSNPLTTIKPRFAGGP